MRVFGKYERDENFTTIFTDNTMYQIARNTGDWGCRKVGEWMANGVKLTQELFNSWKARCTNEATFILR